MSYYFYILKSENKETYYTGISDNPQRRLNYHNSESKGYTQKHRPWKLVLELPFHTKQEALAAERKVKSWKSRRMIERLVQGDICIKDYL